LNEILFDYDDGICPEFTLGAELGLLPNLYGGADVKGAEPDSITVFEPIKVSPTAMQALKPRDGRRTR
jgi:hypothetical protein